MSIITLYLSDFLLLLVYKQFADTFSGEINYIGGNMQSWQNHIIPASLIPRCF